MSTGGYIKLEELEEKQRKSAKGKKKSLAQQFFFSWGKKNVGFDRRG